MIHENPADQFTTVELAKWYEYRCRNFAVAYNLASKVLEGSTSLNEDLRDALLYRLMKEKNAICHMNEGRLYVEEENKGVKII